MATLEQKQKFVNDMFPTAYKASQATNLPASWFIGQWAHETGYGTNTGAKQNNYAGLYAYSGSPYGINGKKYATKDDFLKDYLNTINNKRYSGIYKAQNVTEFAQALKAGGYAEDSSYPYSGTWTEVQKFLPEKASELKAGNWTSSTLTDTDKAFLDNVFKDNKQTWQGVQSSSGYVYPYRTPEEQAELDKFGQQMKDNTYMDEKQDWVDKIFTPIKYGFAIFIVFGLVLFFMYGAFIKDSGAGKAVESVANTATGGAIKTAKNITGGKK